MEHVKTLYESAWHSVNAHVPVNKYSGGSKHLIIDAGASFNFRTDKHLIIIFRI